MSKYIVSETFESHNTIEKGEYEDCIFKNCDLSESDLNTYIFTDCEFVNCNLSNTNIQGTAFRDVKFINCKLMGIQFSECNLFSLTFTFEDCILDFSSFYLLKIKNTLFKNCRLIQADFVEAELNNSNFINCDLSGAMFERTNLEKVNLSSSFNFSIDPELNKIHNATFSKQNILGLLLKYNIKVEE